MMALVKTFRVHPKLGISDRDVAQFVTDCEEKMGCVSVTTTSIPAFGESDPRVNVIVTKLDPDF